MKTIILIIALSLQLSHAQSELLLLMDSDAGFNPLTYDAKTLALYDGDLEMTTDIWADQTTNGYDITFYNSPTIVGG